ncbi:hypothetical protein OUZ56_028394 [Daphnia magna]|uniref:Uncharacterized protein n=1 Tax=Daphnia magna TaxID=35525 RepID=A0ABR0B3Q9_9CRUS|nr:hypothetical protein OUZ56_028394 [Daphnia magna]
MIPGHPYLLCTCKLKIKPAFIKVISETKVFQACSFYKIVNVSWVAVPQGTKPLGIKLNLLTASNWLKTRQQIWKLVLSQ